MYASSTLIQKPEHPLWNNKENTDYHEGVPDFRKGDQVIFFNKQMYDLTLLVSIHFDIYDGHLESL